jgi:hypothetical protein
MIHVADLFLKLLPQRFTFFCGGFFRAALAYGRDAGKDSN